MGSGGLSGDAQRYAAYEARIQKAQEVAKRTAKEQAI